MSVSPDYSNAYLKEAWKVFLGCTGALGARMLTVMCIIKAIFCSYLMLVLKVVLEGAALDLIKPRIYHDLQTRFTVMLCILKEVGAHMPFCLAGCQIDSEQLSVSAISELRECSVCAWQKWTLAQKVMVLWRNGQQTPKHTHRWHGPVLLCYLHPQHGKVLLGCVFIGGA